MRRVLFLLLFFYFFSYGIEMETEFKFLKFSEDAEHEWAFKYTLKLSAEAFTFGFTEGRFREREGNSFSQGLFVVVFRPREEFGAGFGYMPYARPPESKYTRTYMLFLGKEKCSSEFYFTLMREDLKVLQLSPACSFGNLRLSPQVFFYSTKNLGEEKLPAYSLLSLSLSYEFEPWEAEAFVGNKVFFYEEGGFDFHNHREKHLYGLKVSRRLGKTKLGLKVFSYRELGSGKRVEAFGLFGGLHFP